MLRAMLELLGRKRRDISWSSVVFQLRDPLRVHFTQLLLHLLRSPRTSAQQRCYVLTTLNRESRCRDLFKQCVAASPTAVSLMRSHLMEMVSTIGGSSSSSDDSMRLCSQATETLRQLGKIFNIVASSDDKLFWATDEESRHAAWCNANWEAVRRRREFLQQASAPISHKAMDVTRFVVNAQNAERKKLIEEMKARMANEVQTKRAWLALVTQLTHPRAVWHDPTSQPASWQLDPTEGPSRVRKRLKPCHLNIAPRFLRPEHRAKLRCAEQPQPLAFLFLRGRRVRGRLCGRLRGHSLPPASERRDPRVRVLFVCRGLIGDSWRVSYWPAKHVLCGR